MAKQAVGPIGRHIEKAVLALCGGAFLYVIAMYGVVSPNKVGPEGNKVGPEEVDRDVKIAAESLREALQNTDAETEPIPPFIQNLNDAKDPLALAGVSGSTNRPVPFSLPVPDVLDKIIKDEAPRRLVEVVQLAKPSVETGRSGVYLVPPVPFESKSDAPRDELFLQDANWVTIAALFDRTEQERRCVEAGYDRRRVETISLGVDLQRRMQMADGSFSEWQDVTPAGDRAKPVYPEPKVYEEGGVYDVSPEDRKAIESFFELVSDNQGQLDLMRPLFPAIAYPDDWTYPRVEGYDVIKMDEEYQTAETMGCRYPECMSGGFTIDGNAAAKDLLKDARDALEDGLFERAAALADEAARRADRDKDKTDAEALSAEIEKAKAAAGTVAKRERYPVELLWVHDAGDDVVSGRTYQYRVRARIYNRYCGTPTLLDDPFDAEKVEIVGAWSEPSDPITVKQDTFVFLTSAKESKQECKVEVFKRVDGDWVTKAFNVMVGERIAKEGREDTSREARKLINFDAHAVVMDMDFHSPYRGRDRSGRLEKLTQTVAMVYVDENGVLHESLLDFDKKDNPDYQTLKDAARRKKTDRTEEP